MFLMGEANQTGNRFFDFDLVNQTIIYKPVKGKKIEIIFSNYKSYYNELLKLQEYIDNKTARMITGEIQTYKVSRLFRKWVEKGLLLKIDAESKNPRDTKYKLSNIEELQDI